MQPAVNIHQATVRSQHLTRKVKRTRVERVRTESNLIWTSSLLDLYMPLLGTH